MQTVEIITIGDELLIGQVVDTNSAWMAVRLNEWGFGLTRIVSVHDDASEIRMAVAEAMQRADVVLTTGGLGPTKDDITKHVLAELFGTTLVYRDDIRQHLERLYAERPDVLNRLTDTQCLFPETAEMIPNQVGSAQVMHFVGRAGKHLLCMPGKHLLCMPGVPYEMMWCMEHGVGDLLRSLATAGTIVHRTVQTYGMPESSLALLIEDWENALPEQMRLAYLPKDGMIRLRLSGYDVPAEAVDAEIAKLLPVLAEQTTTRLPESISKGIVFATEDKPIEVLLGEALKRRGQTIASAESCTGGKIAALLNRQPGSSAFYYGSVVAYDNSVKEHVLGVSAEDLKNHGAVSESVVRQMAEGVRTLLKTDYAVATSGIAGPDGGTKGKPVGTVWMAVATPEGTYAHCFQLGKLREQVTDRAAFLALLWLYKLLCQHNINIR